MKKIITLSFIFLTVQALAQPNYQPTAENLANRKAFQDMKYGMFIHWGASSVLGDGEWVMNNRKIRVNEYRRLLQIFNPIHFDAATWVGLAKAAGMKYITFITRHHDGFSNWDTKYSDWKITNTPYGKDVLKQLADECHKQGIKLALYYSTLDWYRSDYPYETGRTGQGSGRTEKSNYASYLQFMKNQLTELLTNYGDISGIWFDGHWDQTNVEGNKDRSSRIDWKYEEIYGLIHKLQPGCLIGNNHHLDPIPGEDFQMFERDLPGENKSGLSFQKATDKLPIETCETLNGSWGFNITDRNYKSPKTVVQYIINAAGRNANLLLNIGPMPDGSIQPEFADTLRKAGEWMRANGESIYGARGNIIPIQDWGVATTKANSVYLHIMKPPVDGRINLSGWDKKPKNITAFKKSTKLKYTYKNNILSIDLAGMSYEDWDSIVEISI